MALLELTHATSIRMFEIGVAVEGEAVFKNEIVVDCTNGVVEVQDVVVHLYTVVVLGVKTTS